MKNSSISITATFVESHFIRNFIEKLANRRNDIGYTIQKVQPGWQAIVTSSIEAHVSGDLILSDQNDLINDLFITCFLFTCIKERGSGYSLTWASSLS